MNNLNFNRSEFFFVANAITVSRLRHHYDYNLNSRIICLSEFVSSVLQKNNGHNPDCITVIDSRLKDVFITFFWVLWIKLCNKRLNIFHECCWITLDIAILLFRPKGSFYPYYNLSTLETVTDTTQLNGVGMLLYFCGLGKKFNFFQHLADDNAKGYSIYSVKNYPPTVVQQILPEDCTDLNDLGRNARKVLILLGTDYVPADVLRQIYQGLITRFRGEGWDIAVKGHPNPEFNDHVLYDLKDVKVLSSEIPAENFNREYSLAIGCFSTALLRFKSAVSVLGMNHGLPKNSEIEQQKRIVYLKSQRFYRADQLSFPASEDELNSLLTRVFEKKGNIL